MLGRPADGAVPKYGIIFVERHPNSALNSEFLIVSRLLLAVYPLSPLPTCQSLKLRKVRFCDKKIGVSLKNLICFSKVREKQQCRMFASSEAVPHPHQKTHTHTHPPTHTQDIHTYTLINTQVWDPISTAPQHFTTQRHYNSQFHDLNFATCSPNLYSGG